MTMMMWEGGRVCEGQRGSTATATLSFHRCLLARWHSIPSSSSSSNRDVCIVVVLVLILDDDDDDDDLRLMTIIIIMIQCFCV